MKVLTRKARPRIAARATLEAAPQLPRLHKRERIVAAARLELSETIYRLEFDLTFGELVTLLSQELAAAAKYAIRRERGRRKQPGGLA